MAADSQESELWALSKTETISTFEAWRQSITYTLSSEPLFAPFFNDNVIRDTKSRGKPTRGFTDDNYDVPDDVIYMVNDTIVAVDDAAICPDGDEVEPIDDDPTYTDCDELDREECDIRHIGNDELKLVGDDFAYNARL